MIKLKICGITDLLNAEEIADLEVDFLGLIFAASPRQVSFERAKELSALIHKKGKKVIGVFVDESDESILNCAKITNLDGVQIHKSITKELYESLKQENLSVWQVISVGENLELPKQIHADMPLFDTLGKLKGGNGISFDWSLLENFQQEFILAGGIGLENIKEALKINPSVIDVNSKVEFKAGLKNIDKIKQMIKELKG